MTIKRLRSELKEILKEPNSLYNIFPDNDNFLKWKFIIFGPKETIYEYGIFEGYLRFPKNYPLSPPNVSFKSRILHPNIYKNGKVCMSILHAGSDEYGYEKDSERWNPSHSVNSIMLSLISMLSDCNLESPANLDASKLFRDNYDEFKRKVYKDVALSHV